jgi:hypothetical protein
MLSEQDLEDLQYAHELLETPGFAALLQNLIGKPVDEAIRRLPLPARQAIHKTSEAALTRASDAAFATLNGKHASRITGDWLHTLAVGATGGIAGVFGLPALAVELPVTTVIMLRSIADVARSQGEDLESPETKLACLEVFALGGRTASDDSAEIGYYAVRAIVATQFSRALQHFTEQGLASKSAPAVVRFLSAVAARFGIVVSAKAAATAVPILGAAGGATINALFMDHFQNMARGHFIVRRLERQYGADTIEQEYKRLSGEQEK